MAVDYTYTAVAWTGLVAAGAAAYYIFSKDGKRKLKVTSTKQAIKKKLSSEDTSVGDNKDKAPKKKKRERVPTIFSGEDATRADSKSQAVDSREDEELNNKEFARQFQNAKSGVLTTSHTQTSSRPKSVKQSHAASTKIAEEDSKSSTTGGDGDDDLSAPESPSLGTTTMDKMETPRSGDISDMLEPIRTGPSVMRITESTKPAQPKKERQPAKEEVMETKKQRQNRKKAEAAKLAREEDEKERRILMEKQRRTAREAEGRAAKDGSTFMAAKVPISSAWTAPSATSNGYKNSPEKSSPLLDTYEPATNGEPSSTSLKQSTGNKSSSDWEVIPSEEEQMRLLSEDSEWNTVKTKKPKKKTGESAEASAAEAAPVPKKPAAVKQTSSFAALKDEGAGLKDDEDIKGEWKDGKWMKTPQPNKSRVPIVHEFYYKKEDGTEGVMISHENPEDEWEVS